MVTTTAHPVGPTPQVAPPQLLTGGGPRPASVAALCPDPVAWALDAGLPGVGGSGWTTGRWEQRAPLPAGDLVAVSSMAGDHGDATAGVLYRTEFVDVATGLVVAAAEGTLPAVPGAGR